MVEFSKDYQPPTRGTPEDLTRGRLEKKVITDSVMLALHREVKLEDGTKTKRINVLADNVVQKAVEGDVSAFKEIRDTIEGRPGQSLTVAGDPDQPLETKWTVEFVNATPKGK